MQKKLTDKNFQKEVLENPRPMLVEFGADWCGACHILAPILEQVLQDFKGQIKLGRLDVDAHEWIATAYGVQDLPTLLLFKNGEVIEQIVGMAPKQVIAAMLPAVLQGD